jgi:hypothetical protein
MDSFHMTPSVVIIEGKSLNATKFTSAGQLLDHQRGKFARVDP